MDTPLAPAPVEFSTTTAEVSAFTDVQAYTVATNSPKTNWVRSAVLLSRLKRGQGKFSAYRLINYGNSTDTQRPVWAEVPEPVAVNPIMPQNKRRGGVPALVKIAVQLLNKRKRVNSPR